VKQIIWIWFTGEGSSFLTFLKGDLIVLEDDSTGETVMNSGWCVGRCERTGEKGDFPAETVYVLPSCSKPPQDILVREEFMSGFENSSLDQCSLNIFNCLPFYR
jgi:hypothetical protein